MSLFKSYPFRQCWCIFSLPMCTPISKEKKKEVQSITCKLTLRDSNADIPHRGTLCFFLPWEMLSFQRHTTSAYFTICVGVLWAHKWSQWRVIKGLATIATYFIFELQKKKKVPPHLLLRHCVKNNCLHTLGSSSNYTGLKHKLSACTSVSVAFTTYIYMQHQSFLHSFSGIRLMVNANMYS